MRIFCSFKKNAIRKELDWYGLAVIENIKGLLQDPNYKIKLDAKYFSAESIFEIMKFDCICNECQYALFPCKHEFEPVGCMKLTSKPEQQYMQCKWCELKAIKSDKELSEENIRTIHHFFASDRSKGTYRVVGEFSDQQVKDRPRPMITGHWMKEVCEDGRIIIEFKVRSGDCICSLHTIFGKTGELLYVGIASIDGVDNMSSMPFFAVKADIDKITGSIQEIINDVRKLAEIKKHHAE